MRAFGKLAGRVLMSLLVVGIAMWLFGPYGDVSFDAACDESQLNGGVDAYLEAQEAQVLNIRDNSEKRVIWADTVEALAIARRVGEKVLILSTSTGGTLTALALHEPEL